MDILRFINSRDVREHLKNIDYEFTPTQAAWLVWQCESITLKEKHAAWQEIIDTMPDCEVPEGGYCHHWKSLHKFLSEYMEMENKYITQFFTDEPNVCYQYSEPYPAYYHGCHSFNDSKMYLNFRDANKALDDGDGTFDMPLPLKIYNSKSLREKMQAGKKYLKKVKKLDFDLVRFRKSWVGTDKKIEIIFNSDKEIKELAVIYEDTRKDAMLWAHGPFVRTFAFPLPFKKGDILCYHYENQYPESIDTTPLIFFEPSTKALNDKHIAFRVEAYSFEDFKFKYGGFLVKSSLSPCQYMNLEYYQGGFEGKHRVLLPLKKFCMGEISKEELDNIHRKNIMEEIFKEEE